MTIWRIFVGLIQLTCTWAMRTADERQGQVTDAGLAGAERVGTLRRDADRRRDRPGSTKSKTDRSCGARSHKTSTSGWIRPRLIRTESMNRISPERTRRPRARGSCRPRACSSRCGPPSARGPRRGRPHHLRAYSRAVGERLLDEDVLAGAQRGQGDAVMGAAQEWRWRQRRVAVGQHLVESSVRRPPSARSPSTRQARCRVEVADGDQVPVLTGGEVADQVGAPVAGTDDRDPETVSTCCSPVVWAVLTGTWPGR